MTARTFGSKRSQTIQNLIVDRERLEADLAAARKDADELRGRLKDAADLLDEFVDWRTDCILTDTGCDLHGFRLASDEKCPHRRAKEFILTTDSAALAGGDSDAV